MSDFDNFGPTANPDRVGGDGDEITLKPNPGTYSVTLTDAAAFVSKSDAAFVAVTFAQHGTDYRWKVLAGFKSQAQADMTMKLCRDLGADTSAATSIESLDGLLKPLIGTYYDVEVRVNGNFHNTYIIGRQGQSDVPAPPAAEAVPSGSMDEDGVEIPF